MTETNVFELTQPGTFSDPLTEVLRNGARTLLGQAVEAEVAAWLSTHTDKLTDDGRRRLVRHGHLPEREIVTGIGESRCGARACVTASAKAESTSDFRRRFCHQDSMQHAMPPSATCSSISSQRLHSALRYVTANRQSAKPPNLVSPNSGRSQLGLLFFFFFFSLFDWSFLWNDGVCPIVVPTDRFARSNGMNAITRPQSARRHN